MNYHVRKQGVYIGSFPIEELRRRREAGEFTGVEYVQCEGRNDWQPLDLVLRQGYQLIPPPLPNSTSQGPNQAVLWLVIGAGFVLCILIVAGLVYMAGKVQRNALVNVNQRRSFDQPNPESIRIASKPIVWSNSTKTVADEQKGNREFRLRQWVDGYEKRGERNSQSDAEADLFVRTYIARNYGGPEATNSMSLENESDKLARDPNCTDPLVLTVAADESLNLFDAIHCYERALAGYRGSQHKAYPQLYATVNLATRLNNRPERVAALDASAVALLKQCFADGSFAPADQQQIADIFVNGWGYSFFKRNAPAVCNIAKDAGPDYQWLALTLNGEHEIIVAWAARGGGYANSVTSEGWRAFSSHLTAARTDLIAAWKLHPDWPLAPERMIYVSLGDSDLQEMRTWFDRTTMAQIDYSRAWSDFRWGLRPRWYGNEKAILALGMTAVKTHRFDSDVPRKYIDCINDVESEIELPAGEHIYGRPDIWPGLQQMYEGYINAPSQQQSQAGWRTSYAVVAYFGGKYDVARTQLEALDWKPRTENMQGWNVDLSLMPLEVAARASSLSNKVSAAESARKAGDVSYAFKKYTQMKDTPGLDQQTAGFIQLRLSELSTESLLEQGKWIDLLPKQDNDPGWLYDFGQAHVLPDGALEVESGPKGHMLYSRVQAGMNFEIRGQFEVVRSANKNFQGGLVMGIPNFDDYNWYGFRLKRHDEEGDVVSFSEGWSRYQIVQQVTLNDVTNSFDFTFQSGKVTATVNGIKVFNGAEPPVNIRVPNNSFLVGLGAFNDSPDTVIRYRNVQLKKL